MNDWQETIRRAIEGDKEARARALEPFLDSLRAFIRLNAGPRIRAHESVSDLVQSVCREVLADLGEVALEDELALRRWLFVLAKRKLVDRARRYTANKRGGDGIGTRYLETWSRPDPAALGCYSRIVGPIDAAVSRETQSRIEEALLDLEEEDRQVILLVRIQNVPYAEAASALGRSEGATRVLLSRALARLAKKLEPRRDETIA